MPPVFRKISRWGAIIDCNMHMANNSCNPNCRVPPYEPDDWNNDLVLLMLIDMRDIVSGEAVTFQYKGSMWQCNLNFPSLHQRGFDVSSVDVISPALTA